MTSVDATKGNLTTVLPSIFIGPTGRSLPEAVADKVHRTVVDSNLHVPDMFEITFDDNDGTALSASGITIGTLVEVWAGAPGASSSRQLVTGDVTAIEGVFVDHFNRTVVRGYAKDHRLQRVRRTRTFLNMKDSDIAGQIATQAGLDVGEITETRTAHDHVAQVNQTDWDFLSARAAAIGHEFGVAGGRFYFRKAASTAGAPVDMVYPANLRAFRARVTAGNLGAEAEVRVWDPLAAKVISTTAPVPLHDTARDGVQSFLPHTPPVPTPVNPKIGDLGPAPSGQFVVADRPLAIGSAIDSTAEEVVKGIAQQVGTTCTEADGEAIGDPHVLAGTVLTVSGVPEPFRGSWVVTAARHVIDRSGYRTHFDVSGGQDRSMFGLASGGAGRATPPTIPGVVCGIVTNVGDPLRKGRVKVTLPWLSPMFESDWAPVVQFGAGRRSGAMFLPEAGDEVLVGFEFGDPHRPYVLGGVVNNHTTYLGRCRTGVGHRGHVGRGVAWVHVAVGQPAGVPRPAPAGGRRAAGGVGSGAGHEEREPRPVHRPDRRHGHAVLQAGATGRQEPRRAPDHRVRRRRHDRHQGGQRRHGEHRRWGVAEPARRRRR